MMALHTCPDFPDAGISSYSANVGGCGTITLTRVEITRKK